MNPTENGHHSRFASPPREAPTPRAGFWNREKFQAFPRKKILVVEDDLQAANGLVMWLSSSGFEVVTTYSGHAAIEVARSEHPDAITLDVQLPDLDGREVATRLHDDRDTAKIPIVFVTGKADQHFKQQCAAVGGKYFIRKPYDPDLLIRLLRSLLAMDGLEEMRQISQAKRRQPLR